MIMSVSTATGLWAQIDVHSHAITISYMDYVKAHGAEMDEGFPIPGWNVEDHLAFMDQAGIETAVLTMPAPQPWFGDAAEVGRVSMATEPGVIALFSMQDKADPCKVYILEVYADQQAYQAHIQTAHFRKYKECTADMVQSLKLIDTIPLVMAEFVKKAQ